MADGEAGRRPARDFRGRRWLSVVLRSVHLASVIALGAALLNAGGPPYAPHAGAVVVASGVALWLLDLWSRPDHLVAGAGVSMLAKLALLAWLFAVPALGEPLFWLIVIWSAIFSHAPASFRNARLFRSDR